MPLILANFVPVYKQHIMDLKFKDRLKQARIKKEVSQSELANTIGVHVTNISRYERGENMPTSEVLKKLANALDTTVDFLMSGSLNDLAAEGIADKELLSQFKRVEGLPKDKKKLVKEFLESFLITSELQARLK
jgi:transcriptional regulator with XRE-family HTH domain